MDLKDALKTALEMEKTGRQIYMDIAEKTTNPHVKNTFSYLASEEVNHIVEIEEFIEKENAEIELRGDSPDDTKEFFKNALGGLQETVELAENDIQAYEKALEMETKGYNFYKQQMEAAEDEKAREFFKFLMEQEEAHYELFQKDLEYLKDPANFFSEEEQTMFDGG